MRPPKPNLNIFQLKCIQKYSVCDTVLCCCSLAYLLRWNLSKMNKNTYFLTFLYAFVSYFFPTYILVLLCFSFINLYHDYFLCNFLSLLATLHLIDGISSFLSVLFAPCCLMLVLGVFVFSSNFLFFSLCPLLVSYLFLPDKQLYFLSHPSLVKLCWPEAYPNFPCL